ncbi:MAG: HAD family phosphatase [Chloroflexi bacterium]|nr:HAD family phosphatase [Chloroflexota bacterium]MDA1003602.1 HAD family phosphatase [Chloroflexota bacterium]
MEKKRAILWDNDGVLVDTEKRFFEANRLELAAIGVTATWAQFEEINQTHGVSLLSLSGLEGEDLRDLYTRRDARYSALLRTEKLAIPGMLELLERMKERFLTTGIVTASRREQFDIIHGLSGMLEHVDFAVVREDYARAKPHPDGYLAGIERTGLAARVCIAVEDSPRGITAARVAGLECVFFTPGGVGADRDVGEVFARAGSAEELEVVLAQWLRI